MLGFLHTDAILGRIILLRQRRPPQARVDFKPWASAIEVRKTNNTVTKLPVTHQAPTFGAGGIRFWPGPACTLQGCR